MYTFKTNGELHRHLLLIRLLNTMETNHHLKRALKFPSNFREWVLLLYNAYCVLSLVSVGIIYLFNLSIDRVPSSLSIPMVLGFTLFVTVYLLFEFYLYAKLGGQFSSLTRYVLGVGFLFSFINLAFFKQNWLMALIAFLCAVGFLIRAVGSLWSESQFTDTTI